MPTPVDIALARSGDCQTIAEMSRRLVETGLPWSWTPARVIRHLIHSESVVLTARAGSEIAGFAIMQFGDESAHLNLLAVDTKYQRSGIGRRLVTWLEQSAVVAGTFTVRLETRARNPVSLLFYRKLGYVEAGRIPRYYGGREDALRMAHDLRQPFTTPPQPGEYRQEPPLTAARASCRPTCRNVGGHRSCRPKVRRRGC